MSLYEHQILRAPTGAATNPEIPASDLPEDRARRLVGFLPSRSGTCKAAAKPAPIYSDADVLSGFFLHAASVRRDLIVRTATCQNGGGDTTHAKLDASASSSATAYVGAVFYALRGTAAGSSATITAYNPTTKIVTLGTALTGTANNTTVFAIIPAYGETGAYTVATGTAEDGGASTIELDATASELDDVYVDMVIRLTSGTGAPGGGIITAYDGEDRTATIADTWGTPPDATSVYEIIGLRDATETSYRFVTQEADYVKSHRLYVEYDKRSGLWVLVPRVDVDTGNSDFPQNVYAALTPRVQTAQIADETFVVTGLTGIVAPASNPLTLQSGALRFVSHTEMSGSPLALHEVDRLYPHGMSAPRDFALPKIVDSGSPAFTVTQLTTSPMKIGTLNNDGGTQPEDGWWDYSAYASETDPAATSFELDDWTPNQPSDPYGVYIFYPRKIAGVELQISTGGGGGNIAPSIAIMYGEYWDGSAWSNLPDFADGTSDGTRALAQSGSITWQIPDDWEMGGTFATSGEGAPHDTVANALSITTADYYCVRLCLQHQDGAGDNDGPEVAEVAWIYPLGGWGIASGTYGVAITDFDEHNRESSPNSVHSVALGAVGDDKVWQITVDRNSPPNYYNAPYAAATGVYEGQRVGWHLYRTTAGGATLFRVETFEWVTAWDTTAPTFDDDVNDTEIIAGVIAPDPGSCDPPHRYSCGCEYMGRFVCDDLTRPGIVQISRASGPTQFAAVADVSNPAGACTLTTGQDDGDPIVAITKFGSELVILKRHSQWSIAGSDATQFVSRYVAPIGCAGRDTVCQSPDGSVMYLANDGKVRRIGNTEPMSLAIDDVLAGTYTADEASTPLPVMVAASSAVAWSLDSRYYLAIAGRCMCMDMLTGGWSEVPYGWVHNAASAIVDLGQRRVDTPASTPMVPFAGEEGHAAPVMVLLSPCDPTTVSGKSVYALSEQFPVAAPTAESNASLPNVPGEIAFRPFDGKGFALNSMKRPVRLTVWGNAPNGGTVRVTSDYGGDEEYPFGGIAEADKIVEQGFVDMAGTEHEVTLTFVDMDGVSVRHARLEYCRLN